MNGIDKAGSNGVGPLEGVLDRLRLLRPALAPAAARIADFIIANADNVVNMSVTEVAEGARASEGSVVGLCQQLGARGFQQLKLALARDLVRPVQFIHEDLTRDDDTSAVIEKIFRSGMQALQDTLKVLDTHAVNRAVQAILQARRVELYGIGSAAPIAEDANYRLLRIGIESKVIVDSHVQAISASLAGPDVAVITISHSGSTHETVTATRLAKEAGATAICITNFGKSPLLAHADIVLHTMARETQFRTEAMTSRIAQLAIIDALIAKLALLTYDRAVDTIGRTFEVLSTKRF
ncbi:MurR/RpiR family transcriptional regulator [Microvirga rosea]|uniref:MurR/RpiR family transcriptional regulator n=1 Tax=Microvirga rosea TaxID=2715425 RepID=UPI001D0AD247|nr:MurR/RpiR family transcriptional regulator [Microvirga rosea]MCB8823150.1 MurR/RpiR family transcriptional regulator [Microvirga rosea]